MNIEKRLEKLEKAIVEEPRIIINLHITKRRSSYSTGGTGPESAEKEKAGTQFSK